MADRDRWILQIKELRVEHGVSIRQAEQLALADPMWRRWVERQINTDQRCRRMALWHIKHRGTDALIEHGDEGLKVR